MARLEAAESRYQQLLEGYQQTILLAFREVADLLVSIHMRTEQLTRQREQATAADAAVGLAEVRYRKGLVNYLDVLDAQRTMLAAETQLAPNQRARLTDMVSLYKALGGGMAPDSGRRRVHPKTRPTLTGRLHCIVPGDIHGRTFNLKFQTGSGYLTACGAVILIVEQARHRFFPLHHLSHMRLRRRSLPCETVFAIRRRYALLILPSSC